MDYGYPGNEYTQVFEQPLPRAIVTEAPSLSWSCAHSLQGAGPLSGSLRKGGETYGDGLFDLMRFVCAFTLI